MNTPKISISARAWALFDTSVLCGELIAQGYDEDYVFSLCLNAILCGDSLKLDVELN